MNSLPEELEAVAARLDYAYQVGILQPCLDEAEGLRDIADRLRNEAGAEKPRHRTKEAACSTRA